MATLPDADRQAISNGLQRYWSTLNELLPVLTKPDLKAAVDATDSWIDSNSTSFNNALPTAAKNNMTLAQKTLMFCAVALYRVSAAFCRKIFNV